MESTVVAEINGCIPMNWQRPSSSRAVSARPQLGVCLYVCRPVCPSVCLSACSSVRFCLSHSPHISVVPNFINHSNHNLLNFHRHSKFIFKIIMHNIGGCSLNIWQTIPVCNFILWSLTRSTWTFAISVKFDIRKTCCN